MEERVGKINTDSKRPLQMKTRKVKREIKKRVLYLSLDPNFNGGMSAKAISTNKDKHQVTYACGGQVFKNVCIDEFWEKYEEKEFTE